jgi:hypothetical protein
MAYKNHGFTISTFLWNDDTHKSNLKISARLERSGDTYFCHITEARNKTREFFLQDPSIFYYYLKGVELLQRVRFLSD